MADILVDMRHVQKNYGRLLPVLNDISLTVRAGELCLIRGQSGAGKSTLLNVLGLLDTPDAGWYSLAGARMLPSTPGQRTALRSRLIGFVFQSYHLLESMSVEDNVLLPYLYAKASLNTDAHRRVQAVLHELDLICLRRKRVSLLSGGEKQRVAIARAIIRQPPLVIADEPTGNLDKENAARVIHHLRVLSRAGAAVIVVTHNDSLVTEADTSYTIVDGVLVDDADG